MEDLITSAFTDSFVVGKEPDGFMSRQLNKNLHQRWKCEYNQILVHFNQNNRLNLHPFQSNVGVSNLVSPDFSRLSPSPASHDIIDRQHPDRGGQRPRHFRTSNAAASSCRRDRPTNVSVCSQQPLSLF